MRSEWLDDDPRDLLLPVSVGLLIGLALGVAVGLLAGVHVAGRLG